MSMQKFKTYREAEEALCRQIITKQDYITDHTFEILGTGFVLTQPWENKNSRSNYDYAQKFFEWLMSGSKILSHDVLNANPWAKRFVDSKGLPDSFSTSYGWKIKSSISEILGELRVRRESRRAYINILHPQDRIVWTVPDTTHEYPCTIGMHFMIRNDKLILMVNMRSNNVYAVMPYDVYNFTSLQMYYAEKLNVSVGDYYHQINNAHIFKADVRKLKEQYYAR